MPCRTGYAVLVHMPAKIICAIVPYINRSSIKPRATCFGKVIMQNSVDENIPGIAVFNDFEVDIDPACHGIGRGVVHNCDAPFHDVNAYPSGGSGIDTHVVIGVCAPIEDRPYGIKVLKPESSINRPNAVRKVEPCGF